MTAKIDALEEIRRKLESSYVKMQEEDLELDDERKPIDYSRVVDTP